MKALSIACLSHVLFLFSGFCQTSFISPTIYYQQDFTDRINYLGLISNSQTTQLISVSETKVAFNRLPDFRQTNNYFFNPKKLSSVSKIANSRSKYLAIKENNTIIIRNLNTGAIIDSLQKVKCTHFLFDSDEQNLLIVYRKAIRFYNIEARKIRKDSIVLKQDIQEIRIIPDENGFFCITGVDTDFASNVFRLISFSGKELFSMKGRFSNLGINEKGQFLYFLNNGVQLVFLSLRDADKFEILKQFKSKYPIETIYAVDDKMGHMVCSIREMSVDELWAKIQSMKKPIDSTVESGLFDKFISTTPNCLLNMNTNKIEDTLSGSFRNFIFNPYNNTLVYTFVFSDSDGNRSGGLATYDLVSGKTRDYSAKSLSKIINFSISPDHGRLATLDQNWELRLFSLTNSNIVRYHPAKDSLDFFPRSLNKSNLDENKITSKNRLPECNMFFSDNSKYLALQTAHTLQVLNIREPGKSRAYRFSMPIFNAATSADNIYFQQGPSMWAYDIVKDSLFIVLSSSSKYYNKPGWSKFWYISDDIIMEELTLQNDSGNNKVLTLTPFYPDSTVILLHSLGKGSVVYKYRFQGNSIYKGFDQKSQELNFDVYNAQYILKITLGTFTSTTLNYDLLQSPKLFPISNLKHIRYNLRSKKIDVSEKDGTRKFSFPIQTRQPEYNPIINKYDCIQPLSDEYYFVLNTSGQLSLLNINSGTEIFTISLFKDNNQYLINTADGYFECTASLINKLFWRDSTSNEFYKFETLYNDFFTPGLLSKALSDKIKRTVPIQFYLKIPALRILIANKEITLHSRNKENYLCFNNIDMFSSIKIEQLDLKIIKDDGNATCKYSVRIPEELYTQLVRDTGLVIAKQNSMIFNYPKTKSTLFQMSIGIGSYQPNSKLPELMFSRRSVEKFDSFFLKNIPMLNNSFDSLAILPRLFNEKATLNNILNAFELFIQTSSENDCLVLYLVGHGIVPKGSELFHFFPYDGINGTDEEIFSSTLNTPILIDLIKSLKCRRVILIIDACLSGSAAESISKAVQSKITEDAPSDNTIPFSVNILFSALPYQFSIHTTDGSFLVNNIEKAMLILKEHKENISIGKIFRLILENTQSKYKSITQIPLIITSGTDFELFKYN